MKKIIINSVAVMLLLMMPQWMYSQQKVFDKVTLPNVDASATGGILGVTGDHEGYIWFIAKNRGLYRYDGSQFVAYVHDSKDSNSITSASLETMAIDSDDVIWIATFGSGLDKLDPATNKFTHFRHQQADPVSLANDTVAAILINHDNNVWLGT